ncbi:MAG: helix-turn-helix domain-containing protein [Pseudobdellovibrio sp.]
MNKHDKRSDVSSFSFKLEEEWLNSAEAADYLRISIKTLMNLSSNGTIKYYKFGRLNRYIKSELAKLITPAFQKEES